MQNSMPCSNISSNSRMYMIYFLIFGLWPKSEVIFHRLKSNFQVNKNFNPSSLSWCFRLLGWAWQYKNNVKANNAKPQNAHGPNDPSSQINLIQIIPKIYFLWNYPSDITDALHWTWHFRIQVGAKIRKKD